MEELTTKDLILFSDLCEEDARLWLKGAVKASDENDPMASVYMSYYKSRKNTSERILKLIKERGP